MKAKYDTVDIGCEPEDYEALIRAAARYINEVGEENVDVKVVCAILGIKRSVN